MLVLHCSTDFAVRAVHYNTRLQISMLFSFSLFLLLPTASLAKPFTKRWHPETRSTESAGMHIHPYGDETKCLMVDKGYASEGSKLVINPCSTAPGSNEDRLQQWDIQRGNGTIKLHSTNFCIDANLEPANGLRAKIWGCIPVPQEHWYYTYDNHIALTEGDQCLDVQGDSIPRPSQPYGSLKDVQTWKCASGNVNQLWTTTSNAPDTKSGTITATGTVETTLPWGAHTMTPGAPPARR